MPREQKIEDQRLKPCPFCGRKGLVRQVRSRYGHDISVICESCNARTGVLMMEPDMSRSVLIDEAVELWNRRTYE